MIMYKFLYAALLGMSSFAALAGPNKLDILGLVPGVSELSQVQQATTDPNTKSETTVRLEIGGHVIRCAVSFLNGKLASLHCPTGKGIEKYEQYTEASNIEVHADLSTGFAKKFGKPDSITIDTVRTNMGVEYERSLVTWTDKRGNRLLLFSIMSTVNQGFISLESSEYLKQNAEKNAANEARKKF